MPNIVGFTINPATLGIVAKAVLTLVPFSPFTAMP